MDAQPPLPPGASLTADWITPQQEAALMRF
jgi:hypothetical protein